MPKQQQSAKPLKKADFERFGTAIMQVSKEELAQVIEAQHKPNTPSHKRAQPGAK